MRRLGLLAAGALCAALTVAAPAAPAHAAAAPLPLPLLADWQMNEPANTPPGPQAMADSTGHGFNGSLNVNAKDANGNVDPTAPPRIVTGDTGPSGAPGTAYRWPAVVKDPVTGMTVREDNRLALADYAALDPLSRDYAMELTFYTGAPSPNLVQKGQSGPNAPIFKVEVHNRKASCTLAGFYGTVFAKRAVGSAATLITANQWHTIRCERTYNAVKNTEDIAITVDDLRTSASFNPPAGSTTVIGNIKTPYPVSIGGKAFCEPAAGVGCDYFTGKMDDVRIWAGTPPVAAFTSSCTVTSCSFDGTGSSDADGPVVDWAWAYGDGSTGSGSTAGHTYAAGGTFPVTLTVTDATGSTSSTTRPVTVQAQAGIAFRAAGTPTSATGATARVPMPSGVQPGDALLLAVTTAGTTGNPTPPSGWTEVQRQVLASSTALTVVWQHVATSADTTALTVPVTFAASAKWTGEVLAYTGTSTGSPIAGAVSTADSALTTSHTTPGVASVPAGSWVVSFWSDKSSTTTAWTPPAALTARAQAYGTGSGYLTTLVADEGAPSTAGAAPARTAGTNATSRAGMLTVVLAPA